MAVKKVNIYLTKTGGERRKVKGVLIASSKTVISQIIFSKNFKIK